MAAYAALVSLSHILRQILHPPPLNKITIPRKQIEFLRVKVDFLIDFLETYPSRSSDEIEDLQMRVVDAAYEAEDIIESDVVSQLRENYANDGAVSSALSPQRIILKGRKVFPAMVRKWWQIKYKREIQRMIKEFHSIEEELMTKIKDNKGLEQLLPRNSTTATSIRPLPGGDNITMVGFDKHLIATMDALATDESNWQIIPIVGMGGIGKTTLATAVYNNPFIVEHFHVRAWITVSQEYTVRHLLLRLLSEINKSGPSKQESTDDEIGLQLHKALFDRKYLIVLDDMWDIQAWEKLKMFLPHNENGSRVVVTTRLSNLADDFGSACPPYKMDFLDEGQSWDLLHKKIFAEEDCPVELEEVGKDMAKRCSGLPLALVVIGGLLAKSRRTREHWESVAADVNSAFSYGNDEPVMKILSFSYKHLPLYLKPCFLYLIVFPEDYVIRASTLIRLWVAEGLIKHTEAKCLEEVAHEYLEDLISRNLILVHKRGSNGRVRWCKIHDLLRDLGITQAEKEKFLHIAKLDNPKSLPNIETKRCLSISYTRKPEDITAIKASQSATLNRSWLSHGKLFGIYGEPFKQWTDNEIIHGFRLLKVAHVDDRRSKIDILKLINLRYVAAESVSSISSMSLCWNLQFLIVHNNDITLPAEIWQMPQLRYLRTYRIITLPNPPPGDENVIVLENLQTLKGIQDFRCREEVLKRIPNLKKLRIRYHFGSPVTCEQVGNYYCLKNLVRLKKLESLSIEGADILWPDIALPISLKKLSLRECKIPWEDLSIVGSLPNLEVLKLNQGATKGEEWNPIEGEFCRLKSLFICWCELKIWGAEDYHFPRLERLRIAGRGLEEIPKSFSEILTLQVIQLFRVKDSLWSSATEISDQRELLGYEPLQIQKNSFTETWKYDEWE